MFTEKLNKKCIEFINENLDSIVFDCQRFTGEDHVHFRIITDEWYFIVYKKYMNGGNIEDYIQCRFDHLDFHTMERDKWSNELTELIDFIIMGNKL